MFCPGHYLQVFQPVIGRLFVEVMHDFRGAQEALEVFFDDKSVAINVRSIPIRMRMARRVNQNPSMTVGDDAALPIGVLATTLIGTF